MSEVKQLQIDRCPACGEFLEAGRKNKRFHNSACRNRYWRRMRDIQAHSVTVQRYILDISSACYDDEYAAVALRELRDIVETVNSSTHGEAAIVATIGVRHERE